MARFLVILLALGACAPTAAIAPAAPPPNHAIVYETTPCHGTCPVFRILLTELTGSTFVGEKHTAVIGERAFQAPDGHARVGALLRRWKPVGEVSYTPAKANCPNAPTDMPGVRVDWAGGSGEVTGTLIFYYGCSGTNPELAAALREVPAMLGIDDLIGRR